MKDDARVEFIEKYDAMILGVHMRELYENSGFFNVGDWSRGARTLTQACTHLVERHIKSWPQAEAREYQILDIGCGLGGTTALLAKRYPYAEILGLNISSLQLQHAERLYPGPKYRIMDAQELTLPSSSVDAIISVEAAFHFGDRLSFLRGAFRVLRPGGLMALSDILLQESHPLTADWTISEHVSVDGLSGYESLCSASGFQVNTIEDITANTWGGFCSYLRIQNLSDLADRIEKAAEMYILAQLTKPQAVTPKSAY